jgi:hypothetical protein
VGAGKKEREKERVAWGRHALCHSCSWSGLGSLALLTLGRFHALAQVTAQLRLGWIDAARPTVEAAWARWRAAAAAAGPANEVGPEEQREEEEKELRALDERVRAASEAASQRRGAAYGPAAAAAHSDATAYSPLPTLEAPPDRPEDDPWLHSHTTTTTTTTSSHPPGSSDPLSSSPSPPSASSAAAAAAAATASRIAAGRPPAAPAPLYSAFDFPTEREVRLRWGGTSSPAGGQHSPEPPTPLVRGEDSHALGGERGR